MKQNDGGPAFPTAESHGDDFEGMSLRDYFAAKAMQGFVVRIGKHEADLISHDSYILADAMLKAREK